MGSLPNLHALSAAVEQSAGRQLAAPARFGLPPCGAAPALPPPPAPALPPPALHARLQHTRSGPPQHCTGAHAHGHAAAAAAAACWDDFLLEERACRALQQMAGASPVSSRSSRSAVAAHSLVGAGHVRGSAYGGGCPRRDSLSSSGGASSVRRLIAAVRHTPSRLGPLYSRRVLLRNLAALCLGHAAASAALLPLLALQAAASAWGAGLPGTLLLSAMFCAGAAGSLVAPWLVRRLGSTPVLLLGYAHACVFCGLHLWPLASALVPAYLVMGAWLGPLAVARTACLCTLAAKLSWLRAGDPDDADEEARRRDAELRRLARALQAAQDAGLALGSVAAALLLRHALPPGPEAPLPSTFALDESGERVCGSWACPWAGRSWAAGAAALTLNLSLALSSASSLPPSLAASSAAPWPSGAAAAAAVDADASEAEPSEEEAVPCRAAATLAAVFLGCAVMALAVSAALLDRLRPAERQDPLERGAGAAAVRAVAAALRDPRLRLAAPLAAFTGLEQGFLYADFSQSYVLCALGLPDVSLSFLSLGALQSLAAATLSLLLQHARRCLAIVVGFVFHACLLLVLMLWKPTGDDPALFYVIAAAWGVCNAVWETLTFSFIMDLYPDSWQAPLAQCHCFRCVGLAVAFGVHAGICNWVKLYALAGALVLAIGPYAWLEMKLDLRRKNKMDLASL